MIRDILVKNKTIGILGGMGAAASVYFYSQVVKASQRYGAQEDSEFPPVLLYSLPLVGLTAAGISREELVLAQRHLIAGVLKLEQSGADFIVIPCNTVHYFCGQIRDAVRIPVLSIIEETIRKVLRNQCEVVGVVSTGSTRQWGLYQQELERRNIETITPNRKQQKDLALIIAKITGGRCQEEDRELLRQIVESLCLRGADGVILGCTELPLAITSPSVRVKLFDSASILAETSVRYSMGFENA